MTPPNHLTVVSDSPYFSREEYQDEVVTGAAPWPDYEAVIEDAIRRIRDEDALVREHYDGLGWRMSLKPIDKDDMTTSLMDHATAAVVHQVIDEEDETISENEVVERLEELLETVQC